MDQFLKLLKELTRLPFNVNAAFGIFTGLAPGITPLGVNTRMLCFAKYDEGVIYKMRYRRRRRRQG